MAEPAASTHSRPGPAGLAVSLRGVTKVYDSGVAALGPLDLDVRDGEFVKADRYLRSGLWRTQNFPLSVGSLRDRKVGMVGMGPVSYTHLSVPG